MGKIFGGFLKLIFKHNNKMGSRAFSMWAFVILLFSNLAYADEESEGDVAELEDLTVTDVPDDLSILPSEPSEGAFGLQLAGILSRTLRESGDRARGVHERDDWSESEAQAGGYT